MKRILFYLVALAGLAGLGWWGWGEHRLPTSTLEIASSGIDTRAATPALADDPRARTAPVDERAVGGRGGVGVEAARAEQVSLSEAVSAVGSLRAAESVVLKPEVAGRIARIHFDGGAHVRKGELLVALDASVAAAETEQTSAELALARANYLRAADLARQQFVSERARDEAAANLAVLEARLKLAKARLAKMSIRAPFSGVLGLRNVSPGDFVGEGAELVTLEDVSVMKVDLRLPERYLGRLQRGQRIEVAFDAYPGRRFDAVLEALDVRVDAQGRSVVVRGRLPNEDGSLRTGMFAKVSLTLSQRARAVMIPEEAIVALGSDQYVYRIEEGRSTRVRVSTGLRRDGKVEIVEGLNPGDQVVTAGQLKLSRDGTEVRVVDPPRAGG